MEKPLKEKWTSRIANLFVLPGGRSISPLFVLAPVFLVVFVFTYHLFQESRAARPSLKPHPLLTALLQGQEAAPSPKVSLPVVQETGVQETEAPTLPLAPIYSIRLGVGRRMEFVERALNKLKADHQDPFYQKVGDQYWILIGRFEDEDSAEAQLESLTETGKYKGEVITLSEASLVQRPSD